MSLSQAILCPQDVYQAVLDLSKDQLKPGLGRVTAKEFVNLIETMLRQRLMFGLRPGQVTHYVDYSSPEHAEIEFRIQINDLQDAEVHYMTCTLQNPAWFTP